MAAAKNQDEKALADILFPSEADAELAESILDIAPEQRRLHTDSYDFTVSTLVEYLKTERVRVPVYQRRYVWSETQASRLIESLIIQCPIPVIYLNQEKDESLSVIDGNQRLTSLRRYLSNEFGLSGLTSYPELDGFKFFELDKRFQRHIENRTLRCLVILKETHPQVKFDVFERLNTGSVKLTAQELRHGIYYGDAVLLSEKLARNSEFSSMVEVRDNKRMKLEELVLRFLALKFDGDNYKKPLTGFLNSFADSYRKLTTDQDKTFSDEFKAAVTTTKKLFGDYAFKIISAKRETLSRFNAALYDAEMLAASELASSGKPLPKREAVLDTVAELFNKDEAFRKAVGQATSDEAQVKARIKILRDALLAL